MTHLNTFNNTYTPSINSTFAAATCGIAGSYLLGPWGTLAATAPILADYFYPQIYTPRIDLLHEVRHYQTGFDRAYGWLLQLFDRALYVQDGNKTYYLRTRDLINVICPLIKSSQLPANLLSTSSRIRRLVLEVLNPIMGTPVTIEKIYQLILDFRADGLPKTIASLPEESPAIELAAEKLTELKDRHLKILTYDTKTLKKVLQPGDILFKKIHESNRNPVISGQKASQKFLLGKTKEREGYKYSHVMIYLGNGKVAEATPDFGVSEVRILSLDDKRVALDGHCKNQYQIVRHSNPKLAKEAAAIAKKIATPIDPGSKKETQFKYAHDSALISIWEPSWFGPLARYRYLKNYSDDRTEQLAKDYFGLKGFFCSYLVAYCYQTAESRHVLPEILGKNDTARKLPSVLNAISRSIWARTRSFKYWSAMSESVKFNFDAKRMTPQDLRNFVVRHPEQFKDIYRVQGMI